MKKRAKFLSVAIVGIASLCLGMISCNNNQPTPQTKGKNLPELAISLYDLTGPEATTLLNENGYSLSSSGSGHFVFSNEDVEGSIMFSDEGKVNYVGIEAGPLNNISNLFTEWINSVEKLGFVNVYYTLVTSSDKSSAEYKNLSALKAAIKDKSDAELAHVEFIVFNSEGLMMGCIC